MTHGALSAGNARQGADVSARLSPTLKPALPRAAAASLGRPAHPNMGRPDTYYQALRHTSYTHPTRPQHPQDTPQTCEPSHLTVAGEGQRLLRPRVSSSSAGRSPTPHAATALGQQRGRPRPGQAASMWRSPVGEEMSAAGPVLSAAELAAGNGALSSAAAATACGSPSQRPASVPSSRLAGRAGPHSGGCRRRERQRRCGVQSCD